jgi:hypothetical protein
VNWTNRPASGGHPGSPSGAQSAVVITQATDRGEIPQPMFPDGVWNAVTGRGVDPGGRSGPLAGSCAGAASVTVETVVVSDDEVLTIVVVEPPQP